MGTRSILLTAYSAIGLAVGAAQAASIDPVSLNLAAGYKAAFTCSGYFNADRSLEQIAGDELTNIYPDFREALASLPDAVVDKKAKSVSVTIDGARRRIAQWRPFLGCVQAPSGAEDFAAAPMLDGVAPIDATPFPVRLSNDPALARVVEQAFDAKSYGDGAKTTSVLIVKDGAIIAERYRDGFDKDTPQRTWSVAKSIAATIIGAAVHRGVLAVDEPAGLGAWSAPGDPRHEITIENLLHMSSGLTSPTAGNRTDDIYFGGGRVVDHAVTNRLLYRPRTVWRYANNDTMALMRALRERMKSRDAFLEFPFDALLRPLGMSRTFLETDWNGDFILSSQVWTTPRDLARLGLLYLNDGVWNGARILPKGWASYVATPAPAQPSRGDYGYGAQFWIAKDSLGLPAGTYFARGNRGQYVSIVPGHDVIVIRRGFDDSPAVRFDAAALTRDVLNAIDQ